MRQHLQLYVTKIVFMFSCKQGKSEPLIIICLRVRCMSVHDSVRKCVKADSSSVLLHHPNVADLDRLTFAALLWGICVLILSRTTFYQFTSQVTAAALVLDFKTTLFPNYRSGFSFFKVTESCSPSAPFSICHSIVQLMFTLWCCDIITLPCGISLIICFIPGSLCTT